MVWAPIQPGFPASRYTQVLGALELNWAMAFFSMALRSEIWVGVRQPWSPSASGSRMTRAGRLPMPLAKAAIQLSYAARLPAPPPDWPPQMSRLGML